MLNLVNIPDITLSREEFRFLLFLLKSGPIMGFDADPLEKLTEQQRALSFAHAERSLRARDLASLDEEGKLAVRETILLMVGTCAYPEFLLSVHAFPSSGNPQRVYWNGQNGVIVAHERPEAPLHRLSFVQGRDELLQQFLAMSNVKDVGRFAGEGFTTTNPMLKSVRDTLKKSLPDAIKMLKNEGAPDIVAQELVNILAGDHTVAVVHSLVAKREGEEPEKSSVTVLSGKTSTWLSVTSEDDTVAMKPTDKDEIRELFASWTAPVDGWIQIPQE
jgi:hypothetical protein